MISHQWLYGWNRVILTGLALPRPVILPRMPEAKHITHTHTFNGPLSGTTRVSQYQKGKTSLDSTEARDSEWQWHQLGHMQVCTSLQTDNHARTPPLSFLQAGCPSCRPTNSVKALKAHTKHFTHSCIMYSHRIGLLTYRSTKYFQNVDCQWQHNIHCMSTAPILVHGLLM